MGFSTKWVSFAVHTEPEEIEEALENAMELAGQRLKEMREGGVSSFSDLELSAQMVVVILPPEDWEMSGRTLAHMEVLGSIGRKVGISVALDYGSKMGLAREPRKTPQEILERIRREGRSHPPLWTGQDSF